MATRSASRTANAFAALAATALILAIIAVIIWQIAKRAEAPATAPASTAAANTAVDDRPAFAGLPRSNARITILKNKGYIAGYSDDRKNPLWVCYRVFNVEHYTPLDRPRVPFAQDPRTAAGVRNEDYSGSGYDRGHMAPNHAIAKCYGAEAQLGTFIVSNICPQRPTLNQKVWEALEYLEADVYPAKVSEVYVIDGPIFGATPRTIGTHKVQVPESFYKILLENHTGAPRTLSVIMPQTVVEADARRLSKFLAPIRQIESATGLQFYPDLPDAERQRLEDAKPSLW